MRRRLGLRPVGLLGLESLMLARRCVLDCVAVGVVLLSAAEDLLGLEVRGEEVAGLARVGEVLYTAQSMALSGSRCSDNVDFPSTSLIHRPRSENVRMSPRVRFRK